MKYEIKREAQKAAFKPFSVTLTFETREEYVNFHDNAMGKITETTSHKFHGDVFDVGRGNIDAAEGTI